MLRTDPAGAGGASGRARRIVLYVEGPRDREILCYWAQRLAPRLARIMREGAVILGGRRPVRAVEHFRGLDRADGEARAVCVLDRDGGGPAREELPGIPGLEFHTWGRRHIESYLLVPDAIRRTLRLSQDDDRVERLFRELVPEPDDERAFGSVDAKRWLDARGPLAQELGRAPAPGRIARSMRASELHPEVHDLMERLCHHAGLPIAARPRQPGAPR